MSYSTTAQVHRAAASPTTVTLSAGSTGEAWYVYNDSSATLCLKYGPGAALDLFTVKVMPGGFYEAPSPVFRGLVTGIWDAVDEDGAAMLTEVA